jgi:hypothetical protein
MPKERAAMIAVASASLGLEDSETFIQMAITEALMKAAEEDKTLRLMLIRSGGIGWDEVELAARR